MKFLIILRFTVILAVISLFTLVVFAEGEIDRMIENAPDVIRGELEDKEITPESFGFDFISEKITGIVKKAFPTAFGQFSKMIGILLFSSLTGLHFKDALGGKAELPISLLSTLSLALIVLKTQGEIIEKISIFISSLTAFVTSTAPILSGIQLITANTAGAAVTSQSFLFFSSGVEFVFTYVFLPLYELLTALGIISSVSNVYLGATSVTAFFKRSLTLLLSFAAILYVTVLSYQTELAAATDSVMARSLKFAVSSSVPIIGGAISDAVRMAVSSFSVIKSSAGVVGIVVLLLLILPIITELFLLSLSYGITAFIAKMLGCEREATLLTEARSITDLAIATVFIASVVFVISLAIFLKTTPPIFL